MIKPERLRISIICDNRREIEGQLRMRGIDKVTNKRLNRLKR